MSTNLEILTAEGEIFNQEVDVVVLPGIEGELAILPGHAPLVTQLDAGQLVIRTGEEEEYLVGCPYAAADLAIHMLVV